MKSLPELLLGDLTRTQIREIAARTLVVLPVGAIEQHGPHLPVGTDTFCVEHIARHATSRASEDIPVVVTPTLPFGSSHHHQPLGATMSIRSQTYYHLVRDLCESLVKCGFTRIFIVNGHGGNHDLLQVVARDIALEYLASVAAVSYWQASEERSSTTEMKGTAPLPGHAGVFETSLIMALRTDLTLRLPTKRRGGVDPVAEDGSIRWHLHGWWERIDGYTDDPRHASAGWGREWLDGKIMELARALIKFYHASDPER